MLRTWLTRGGLAPRSPTGEPLALDLDLGVDLDLQPGAAAEAAGQTPPILSLEQLDKLPPAEPEADFWGDDPDVRPSR